MSIQEVISVSECMKMCDNDEEFMNELVAIMRDDLLECLDLLANAFADKDREQMRELAHRVKGQAANLAAKPLFEIAKKVENAAKTGNVTKNEYLFFIQKIKEFNRCTLPTSPKTCTPKN